MNIFKKLLNNIFVGNSPIVVDDAKHEIKENTYSETIDDVVYVTTANATRLISDNKSTPPSPELKEAVKSVMFESMVASEYDNQKEVLKEGLSSDEISQLIGSKKDSQSIVNDSDEKDRFMKETGKQTRPSEEAIAQAKEDVKSTIPTHQATRSKIIKKKQSLAHKKRKNK